MYIVREDFNDDVYYYTIKIEDSKIVWDWIAQTNEKGRYKEDISIKSKNVDNQDTCLDGRELSQFHIDHLFLWGCRQI